MPPGAVDRKTLTTLLSMTMYQSATLTFVLYECVPESLLLLTGLQRATGS